MMNILSRSVLALYTYDDDPNTLYFMDYVGVYGVKKGPLSNE